MVFAYRLLEQNEFDRVALPTCETHCETLLENDDVFTLNKSRCIIGVCADQSSLAFMRRRDSVARSERGQCNLTRGSVWRLMRRARVSSAMRQKPCRAQRCILYREM